MTLVRTAVWACAACVIGCGAGAPAPVIHSFTPARGYSDREIRVFIRGEGFLPAFQIDPSAGRRGDVRGFTGRVGAGPAGVALRDFDWIGVDELSAWMDPGLPIGEHPVEISDPRGESARLLMGFVALGPDRDLPTVRFLQPAPTAPTAAGIPLRARLVAADREPGRLAELRWELRSAGAILSADECSLGPDPAAVTCEFQASVPQGLGVGDPLELAALATDEAQNVTEETLFFRLQARPVAVSITPARGGIAGGTDVVIRGSGFPPGSRVLVDGTPLDPRGDAGILVDGGTISGRMPPHVEGSVSVMVRTSIGDAVLRDAFTFELPPKIKDISPEAGDPAGGTAVRIRGELFSDRTKVFFGDRLPAAILLGDLKVVSAGEITGVAPPGRGRTSVWAFDPEVGWSRLEEGFGWSPP
jgi:hypothetical protein